ncbi:MAG: YaaL family protein [Bacillota bacterium]|nr:YaaL family protein [Bacillota bacterium]
MLGTTGTLGGLISKVAGHLMLEQPGLHSAAPPGLRDSVEQAKREWLCARSFFDQVTDPDLVDYAIYQVKATEKRYMYLLQQARNNPQLLAER